MDRQTCCNPQSDDLNWGVTAEIQAGVNRGEQGAQGLVSGCRQPVVSPGLA
jgi:hypothetical protein